MCVSETRLHNFDKSDLASYKFYSKVRRKFVPSSGGVGIFVKVDVADRIEIINGRSDCAMWCTLKGNDGNGSIPIGVVYISPEGSRYASNDRFDTFGEDLIRIFNNGNNLPVCILMGDFNARAALLSDFEVHDTTVMNSINIDEVTKSNVLNENLLQNQSIMAERYFKDKKSNSHRNELIEPCKCFEIHICNED